MRIRSDQPGLLPDRRRSLLPRAGASSTQAAARRMSAKPTMSAIVGRSPSTSMDASDADHRGAEHAERRGHGRQPPHDREPQQIGEGRADERRRRPAPEARMRDRPQCSDPSTSGTPAIGHHQRRPPVARRRSRSDRRRSAPTSGRPCRPPSSPPVPSASSDPDQDRRFRSAERSVPPIPRRTAAARTPRVRFSRSPRIG